MNTSTINCIARILAAVGAVNWGLVALLNLNLVALIFGDMTLLAKVIYVAVGASGVLVIINTVAGMTQETHITSGH